VIVHLVDGTYELFRHFYGLRRARRDRDPPFGAVAGVLHTVLKMIEDGATHVGVATDHVIESFRNALWPGYKTGEGIEPALAAQFQPLEDGLAAMGVVVWPMIELEADDALASAAHVAAMDDRVEKVCIWANDKDLAQCVRGDRVVQVDRRAGAIRGADGVREKFGVDPSLIPTAARLLNEHGRIEDFPPTVLGANQEAALLFKQLATLRTDADLFADVDALEWHGPTPAFAAWADRVGDARVLQRSMKASSLDA